jgi:hypothetical protein
MTVLALALRFVLELAGFVAFGVVAATATGQPLTGVAASIAVIAVWAVVAAPKARKPLRQPERDAIGTAILLVAAVALVVVGQPVAGLVFGAAVLANAAHLGAIGPAGRDAFMARTGGLD